MTNREITSEIINILKSNNKDNRLSRRFVLSLLRDSAEFLIAQKWGERSILMETSLYSFIPCFEFEKIDVKDCPSIEFSGNRDEGFTFTPTGGFTPSLILQSTTITSLGTITDLFNKTNNNSANLSVVASNSGVLLNVINIFNSTNLWAVFLTTIFLKVEL